MGLKSQCPSKYNYSTKLTRKRTFENRCPLPHTHSQTSVPQHISYTKPGCRGLLKKCCLSRTRLSCALRTSYTPTYIYIYTYIYTYIYIYIHSHTHTHTHARARAHTRPPIYTSICLSIHITHRAIVQANRQQVAGLARKRQRRHAALCTIHLEGILTVLVC